jgi:hypothetical protein
MQRTDIDLRALAASGKDASQKVEDAAERLLRLAATAADHSRHFESVVSFCDPGKYSLPMRSCAYSLIPSCALYDGDGWGKLVQAVISEVRCPAPASPRAALTSPPADQRCVLGRTGL